MSAPLSISVVLPAFNEEEAVAGVVASARAALEAAGARDFEILVVDDGSTDATAERAASAGARVVRHPTNMGYGRALLTGFERSSRDWILMMDADGTYPVEALPALLEHVPAFDMVVGARQGSFFWGNPFRALLRWIYLRMASFVAGFRIPDANSGLRLIRRGALAEAMPVVCYGYSLSTTMTLSFLQSGLFVKFVPIAYRDRTGRSKVSMPRDILRTLQIMVRVILHYNPLKFAVVLALAPAGAAALFAARFASRGSEADLALAFAGACVALLVFLAGCLLESLGGHPRTPPRSLR